MNRAESVAQATELAKSRWAALHPFDLSDDSWERLFQGHYIGDVLQAITLTKFTRSRDPEIVYDHLVRTLQQLADKRSLRTSQYQ